jgi:hypothetical protein
VQVKPIPFGRVRRIDEFGSAQVPMSEVQEQYNEIAFRCDKMLHRTGVEVYLAFLPFLHGAFGRQFARFGGADRNRMTSPEHALQLSP